MTDDVLQMPQQLQASYISMLREAYFEAISAGYSSASCPFGSTDIYGDVLDILGIWPLDGEDYWSDEQLDLAENYYQKMLESL